MAASAGPEERRVTRGHLHRLWTGGADAAIIVYAVAFVGVSMMKIGYGIFGGKASP